MCVGGFFNENNRKKSFFVKYNIRMCRGVFYDVFRPKINLIKLIVLIFYECKLLFLFKQYKNSLLCSLNELYIDWI